MEFCAQNSAASRSALLRTIVRSYVRRSELQRYFARAIRELQPLYEALASEVEKHVRVGERKGGEAKNRFVFEMKKGSVQSSHVLEAVVRFVIELVKMQCSSPILFLYCLKKLWTDRTQHHILMIALLVESLGPLMLYVEEMRGIMNKELDHVKTVCLSKVVSADAAVILMNAYYVCRPDERPAIKRVEVPPQQRYLQFLLGEKLERAQRQRDLDQIVSSLACFNIYDTTTLLLIVHELLAVPIRSSLLVENATILIAKLAFNVPRLGCMLVDQIYERIFCFLDAMAREKIQEVVGLLDLVGMMFEYNLFSESQIVSLLYLFLEYGHIVPSFPRFYG